MTPGESRKPYADFLSILRRSTDLLNEDPVREEIFSVERLEQYAAHLAAELGIRSVGKKKRSLLPSLRKCGDELLQAYLTLASAIRGKQAVSPAAEWFVDNFHIVEDQLREIKQDLPANYYDELPKLADGELQGYPRVYALALAIIAHTDSRLDPEMLRRFLKSYQQVAPLHIGELWAVAITLRIALVEHLKPLALLIVHARKKREEADALADRLLALAARPETQSHDLIQLLSEELGQPAKFERSFIVQLTQRLRDQSPDVWPAFAWLETQLKNHGTDTLQVTQLEHFRQAASQVTVGNIISSMRFLSALDWRKFVESVSLVDRILERDPAGTYGKMEFATRDSYRHAIERMRKRSPCGELEIAEKAIANAEARKLAHPSDARLWHVGIDLVGSGMRAFEEGLDYRPRLRERIPRLIRSVPGVFYLGSLALVTAGFLAGAIGYFLRSGGSPAGAAAFALLAVFPSSEFALVLLNHYLTIFLKPETLPKIETEEGLPEGAYTMVVVPTLFTKVDVVRELLENLQVHYLANEDKKIFFALLSDFSDAATETTPTDASLMEQATKGIAELNARYGTKTEPRFFLFHRRRTWNPVAGKWMGWERKRGKLLEFNRLLRGAGATGFLGTHDVAFLSKIRYVITLDSDTQLPRDSARRLVGTIEHPLNQPVVCPARKRVVAGYGILQPRIGVSMMSAARSRFAGVFSGNTGLDPYTMAVSDVYQDLFAEGSYTGKGLYVVDAFEAALAGRVPENSILSHDLFEGLYARAGLVTDIELIDDYPTDFDTYAQRLHRWTRGDWQIVQWLFPRVPDAEGEKTRNALSMISRWKIFDNLRRSVVPIASLLWLIAAWTMLPGLPWVWTSMIVLLSIFPVYAPMTTTTFLKRGKLPWIGYVRAGWAETRSRLTQVGLTMVFLVDQAAVQADAIFRTLYRVFLSRRKLLEWISFAQARAQRKKVGALRAWVGPGPVLAIGLGTFVLFSDQAAFPIAAPFLFTWFLTPLFKKWTGNKAPHREAPLSQKEIRAFRGYARRTWHFFETFLSADDNWLAPDNFQEDPLPVLAHRTSPTNIGLQLLSSSAAFDFGYLGVIEFVENLEKTFASISKLPTLHGHLYNWYDTRTLEPLRPQYISTVDSGNLCGHLLTLKQACLELSKRPIQGFQSRDGLLDTLLLLREEAGKIGELTRSSSAVTLEQMTKAIDSAIESVRFARWHSLEEWGAFLDAFLANLLEAEDIMNVLASGEDEKALAETRVWMSAILHQVREFQRDLKNYDNASVPARLEAIMSACDELALGMDFRFLYDEYRKIFVIGFNATDGRRDVSYYDLLASESRLASFVAIAKGDIPKEHWFRLGRQMTSVRSGRALVAWTATMFEYLMPLLVMRRYEGTLLDQTYRAVVARQIEYGMQQGVPWGISEAGYNARDLQLNYQYGPFGIPGLGLKRGLSDELVISPYSTMLAAMIDPRAALENLGRLERLGALSRYGFFESIDYTPERLPTNQNSFILRSFMAHHQGMSLVALDNLLNRSIMQRRFHAEPLVQATQLLLQERIPLAMEIRKPRAEEVHSAADLRFASNSNPRLFSEIDLPTPRTQLLSNGVYSVMVTTTGAGYSRSSGIDVSRWREDATRDHWGQYFYIRNRTSGRLWSAAYQPTEAKMKDYEVSFAEDKVEFLRRDGKIVTHTEIIVSPEDNVELRRVSLTNEGDETREVEVTSLLEVAIAKPADDSAHPAFSKLFVQIEFASAECALLATRRQRSKGEAQIWAFHVLVTEGESIGAVQYETDRDRFLGRGGDAKSPLVVRENRPLSNTVGAVLDPIFSLRETVRIAPGETARITFSTGVAGSREEALRLTDKYHDIHMFAREAELAWTKAQVQLRHLNITMDKAHTFQRLAGRVIYSDPSLRPSAHLLALNAKTQANLWAYGISGDLPIILTRISDEKDMAMVRELLHAHEYLRLKGLLIDLVILNVRPPSYLQSLQDELLRQIRMSGSQTLQDKPGGVFIRRNDLIPDQDATLLKSVARVVLSADQGTLDEQIRRRPVEVEYPKHLLPTTGQADYPEAIAVVPKLRFFNGIGGFSDDGSYVIVLKEGQWTPAPWINVIANALDFGFTVSEAGAGYTWSVNSRENRLSSWSNDPVSDPVSEAVYIRDEESGAFWSPTPLPVRESETYVIRHAQGYSEFQHTSHGIEQELLLFVPLDAGVKISRLRLKNPGKTARMLSVTSYAEIVLGVERRTSAPHVVSELDQKSNLIFARNSYNNEFASRIAFADVSAEKRTFTCDRKEFLGRNRSPSAPEAMMRDGLSGRLGAGLDPCIAFQTKLRLAPGEEREVIILLGQAETHEEGRAIARKYRNGDEVRIAFENVKKYWEKATSVLEIRTPDHAMNLLSNHWLVYQTLSCRVWARSAFYQSGGAYGFRDQLQDVMALVYSNPGIARDQILRASARQFKEGDVQHWWHPPSGRGVRTHFSDDLLWLPYVVSFYVRTTGDSSVLDEVVPYLEAPLLNEGQDDSYLQPRVSSESSTIREHCARAIDRSLRVGAHGLPLMGSGDWNDGMNRVGHEGKGESVWVAWFLISILRDFPPLCEGREEFAERLEKYRAHGEALKAAVESEGWDGDWYRRAYFDDGTPLGSAANAECRIDSIAQTWAVLSGAGDPQRAARAMAAVDVHLIHRSEGLVKLFTPPFDKGSTDPGYIKGYVPGVRENGGQYTHAAIWALMAFAKQGDGDRASELYALLNPINHALTRAGLHKYKVEPYIVAADIYSFTPNVGRGGWTWYTGSASWMYRAAIESILGFRLEGETLRIEPCIPSNWPGFGMTYRRGTATYQIEVKNREAHSTSAQGRVVLDGKDLQGTAIPLLDDGKQHRIEIQL